MRVQYDKAVILLKNGTKLITHTVGVFVAVELIMQKELDIMGGGICLNTTFDSILIIVTVSFIGGWNRSTGRITPTGR